MTMDSVEQLVRFRLAQREKAQMREYIEEHPNLSGVLDKAHKKYEKKVLKCIDSCLKDVLDEEEIEELKTDALRSMLPIVKSLFSLDKLVENAGGSYYKNTEALKEEWKKKYEQMQKEIDEELSVDFSQFSTSLLQGLECARAQDTIVARLTDYARKSGIETTMQDDVIYGVTRELFPTKEDYLQHIKQGRELLKNVLLGIGSAFAGLDKENEGIGRIGSAVFTNMDVYIEVLQKQNEVQAQEEMKKIYASAE